MNIILLVEEHFCLSLAMAWKETHIDLQQTSTEII